MPPGTIYVGRPTKWGNSYVVGQRFWPLPHGPTVAVAVAGDPIPEPQVVRDRAHAVALFRAYWLHCLASDYPSHAACRAALGTLRGHDLACWCSKNEPCHADVLLELANAMPPEAGE